MFDNRKYVSLSTGYKTEEFKKNLSRQKQSTENEQQLKVAYEVHYVLSFLNSRYNL